MCYDYDLDLKCFSVLLTVLHNFSIQTSDDHDELLCREILLEEPFRFKAGTRERGQVWDKIAHNINSC